MVWLVLKQILEIEISRWCWVQKFWRGNSAYRWQNVCFFWWSPKTRNNYNIGDHSSKLREDKLETHWLKNVRNLLQPYTKTVEGSIRVIIIWRARLNPHPFRTGRRSENNARFQIRLCPLICSFQYLLREKEEIMSV